MAVVVVRHYPRPILLFGGCDGGWWYCLGLSYCMVVVVVGGPTLGLSLSVVVVAAVRVVLVVVVVVAMWPGRWSFPLYGGNGCCGCGR